MCRGKLWLLFALIASLEVAVIKCWTHTERMAEDPLHPGKCYNSQYQLYLKPGESVGGFEHNDRRFCMELTCARSESDGELNLIYSDCPFINPERGCTIEPSYNEQPFPICCSYLNCPTSRPDSDDDYGDRGARRHHHRIHSEDDYGDRATRRRHPRIHSEDDRDDRQSRDDFGSRHVPRK